MNSYCVFCGAPAVPRGRGIFFVCGLEFETFWCNVCSREFRIVEGAPQ